MLDSNQIKEYISLGNSSGFYGYGKWDSEIYLIGIEEAGCYSENLIQQKLDKYFALNNEGNGLFDNRSFQYDLMDNCDPKLRNYSDFFDGRLKKGGYVPKIATFLKILENCDLEKYEYVQTNFGSTQSNHALIEIFPLPSPEEKNWFYPSWVNCTELPFMKKKKLYRNEVIGRRTAFIREKIETSPNKKLILFIADGNNKLELWNQITPVSVTDFQLQDRIRYHVSENKMYVVLPFPGSWSSNGFFNSEDQIIGVASSIKAIYNQI
jgi:hypothetical protein